MEERESPSPAADHCYRLLTLQRLKRPSCKSSSVLLVSPLVALDYVNNQNVIMTHCDKKPRGKVGRSLISVYQALLHCTHREPGDEVN